MSADSIEAGDTVALDAEGVLSAAESPRVVEDARQVGITVYLEFTDGRPGMSLSFDEVISRQV